MQQLSENKLHDTDLGFRGRLEFKVAWLLTSRSFETKKDAFKLKA